MTGVLADFWNAVEDVSEAHFQLREINPEHPLLSWVSISGERISPNPGFARTFKGCGNDSYALFNAYHLYADALRAASRGEDYSDALAGRISRQTS